VISVVAPFRKQAGAKAGYDGAFVILTELQVLALDGGSTVMAEVN
jgi:hypothetical protein